MPVLNQMIGFVTTNDPDKAKRFYGRVLGFALISEDEYALVFDANGTMLRVGKGRKDPPPSHTILGWEVSDIHAAIQTLRAQGVTHAALFGSIARGDDRPDSDIDIMIELDPAARVTMFDYVEIKEYIEGLFSEPVDVVNRDGLKPLVRPKATADAIYAF